MRPSFANPFGTSANSRGAMDLQIAARDALLRVESMILGKKQELCLELIAELVFLEKHVGRQPAGGAQLASLNLVQEFQLVVVMCEFFARPGGTEVAKNAMFLSLFGTSAGPFVSRSKVLAKLISTAVSGSIVPVLQSAGVWMQQIGPVSSPCLGVAQRLIDDFVNFSKTCPEQLKSLPTLAPRFAINFMTSATEMYLLDATKSASPPAMLVELFTNWMLHYPTLCLTAQQPLALPVGAVPMPIVTPIAGLIRWSVLAPIHAQSLANATVFAQLHLAVLQCLAQIPNVAPKLCVINSLHLTSIVAVLQQSNHNAAGDDQLQCSLERFAQSVQLALTARTVSGNTNQLLCRLDTLHHNPLLQIVVKLSHKSPV